MKIKNYSMANKGRAFEEEVNRTNLQYQRRGIALVQKISTPWTVVRRGNKIVSAHPTGRSTLDFRGTVSPGISISFDCKETTEEKGLPLPNILDHQIDYIRTALEVGEVSFILCYLVKKDKRYFIPGETVIKFWDRWKANKGKKGYNFIPTENMKEIKSRNGIILDYMEGLEVI